MDAQEITPVRKFSGESLPRPRVEPDFGLLEGPLDLEIGAGVGDFALSYIDSNPGRTLISIEKTKTRFRKFEEKYRLGGSPGSLKLVHANAVSWIYYHLEKESVDRCFLLYPNPNPKKEHENQRWARMPFMEVLLDKIRVGGELTLATNIESYFKEGHLYLTEFWGLECTEEKKLTQESCSEPRTLFEKKYLERGETCFQGVYRKMKSRLV